MINCSETGVIILAAGSSSRLGSPKQLVSFQGKTLIQKMIDLVEAFPFAEKKLVLGAHSAAISEQIHTKDVQPIWNENWAEGIGSSIRFGLASCLSTSPDLKNLLILLTDQPFVSQNLILQMLELQSQQLSGITACIYEEIIGVPAIFSATFFPDLLNLQGDTGARKIIQQHLNQVKTISFPKGKIDIDEPQDLEKLLD